jgi:hypothetical protein
MLAVKLVVAVRAPKVALPVLMPAGVPHPKAPVARVYWTKEEPVQSASPVWEKRPRIPRSVVVAPLEMVRFVEDAKVVESVVPVAFAKVVFWRDVS